MTKQQRKAKIVAIVALTVTMLAGRSVTADDTAAKSPVKRARFLLLDSRIIESTENAKLTLGKTEKSKAARLGKPKAEVEMLHSDHPRNRYLPNGHMPQSRHLKAYLPTNGGLLWTVALMAAGWDVCPASHAPGFPADGQWVVRWEGLHPAP